MATRAEESKSYATAAGHSGMQLGGGKRNPKEGSQATPSKQKVSRAPFWIGSALRQLLYSTHTWESRLVYFNEDLSDGDNPFAKGDSNPRTRGKVTLERRARAMRLYQDNLHFVVDPVHKKINSMLTQESAEATPDGKARRKLIPETVDIQMEDDAQAEQVNEERKAGYDTNINTNRDKFGQIQGYLVLSQNTYSEGGKMEFVEFTPETVLAALASQAADLAGMPILPQEGFSYASKRGPYFAYYTYADCITFASAYPQIDITCDDYTRAFKVQARRVDMESIDRSLRQAKAIYEDKACYINVYLEQGFEFAHVQKHDLIAVLREVYNLVVIRASRPVLKIDGAPMGKGCQSNYYNVTLKPLANIKTYEWPNRIEYFKEVEVTKWDGSKRIEPSTFALRYSLAGHEAVENLCGLCHQPKKEDNSGRAICVCSAIIEEIKKKDDARKEKREAAKPSQGEPEAKRPKPNPQLDFINKHVQMKKKQCPFLAEGKCSSGRNCRYDHTFMSEEAIKEIPCKLFKSQGMCVAGGACVYTHSKFDSQRRGSKIVYIIYMLNNKQRNKLAHINNGNTTQMNIKYKMKGLNARGLKSENKLKHLLQEAKYGNIAILFVQEHNFSADDANFVSREAKRAGYYACMAYRPDHTSTGGAAIFLHAEILGLKSCPDCRDHDGALVTCKIDLNGEDTNLFSMYVPVTPADRKHFVTKCTEHGWIPKHAIGQGDFNSVPNPALDVRYEEGSSSKYANLHAHAVESMLASSGLEDVFRTYAGMKREYTRRGDSVLTRIDRWYGPAYNSRYIWYEVETDSNFGRAHRTTPSDHLAVSAEIAIQGTRSKKVKPTPKINTHILENEHVHEMIHSLWKGIYKLYDTKEWGHACVWEYFKEHLYYMLIDETDQCKQAKKKTDWFLKRMRTKLIEDGNKEGPSKEHNDKLAKLDHTIRDETIHRQPAAASTGNVNDTNRTAGSSSTGPAARPREPTRTRRRQQGRGSAPPSPCMHMNETGRGATLLSMNLGDAFNPYSISLQKFCDRWGWLATTPMGGRQRRLLSIIIIRYGTLTCLCAAIHSNVHSLLKQIWSSAQATEKYNAQV